VLCGLDLDTSFASYLVQDETIVLLRVQILGLENFFLVCILIGVASGTFFQPHLALGYCEGVIVRFSGLDIKLLGRLKKPVMTKARKVRESSQRHPV